MGFNSAIKGLTALASLISRKAFFLVTVQVSYKREHAEGVKCGHT